MKKKNITVHLPVELIDRMRNVVYWTAGVTMSSLVEDAVAKHIEFESVAKRPQELVAGRKSKELR